LTNNSIILKLYKRCLVDLILFSGTIENPQLKIVAKTRRKKRCPKVLETFFNLILCECSLLSKVTLLSLFGHTFSKRRLNYHNRRHFSECTLDVLKPRSTHRLFTTFWTVAITYFLKQKCQVWLLSPQLYFTI